MLFTLVWKVLKKGAAFIIINNIHIPTGYLQADESWNLSLGDKLMSI